MWGEGRNYQMSVKNFALCISNTLVRSYRDFERIQPYLWIKISCFCLINFQFHKISTIPVLTVFCLLRWLIGEVIMTVVVEKVGYQTLWVKLRIYWWNWLIAEAPKFEYSLFIVRFAKHFIVEIHISVYCHTYLLLWRYFVVWFRVPDCIVV